MIMGLLSCIGQGRKSEHELFTIYGRGYDRIGMYSCIRIYRAKKEQKHMKKESLFIFFLEGISMVLTLYEISRTGKKSKR